MTITTLEFSRGVVLLGIHLEMLLLLKINSVYLYYSVFWSFASECNLLSSPVYLSTSLFATLAPGECNVPFHLVDVSCCNS
uniref:Uncharacterized protein n=1 Tax=Arundo donax TaxID=35708 RepID=A0A0A9FVD1_ARUDO